MELTELDETTTTRLGASNEQPTDLEESKEPEDPTVVHRKKINGIFESSFSSNIILNSLKFKIIFLRHSRLIFLLFRLVIYFLYK